MYDLKANHYNCDLNGLHCKQNYIKGSRKLSMHCQQGGGGGQ